MSADLAAIYNRAAMAHGPEQNPVIVIPGILGSRLVDTDSGQVVWGAFGGGAARPDNPEGARLIALPMQPGVPLAEQTDQVATTGALDRVEFSLLGLPIQLEAYAQIMATLGVGGYIDEELVDAGVYEEREKTGTMSDVDWGDDHFTCFQFAYDWRRDNVENAGRLFRFIRDRRAEVQTQLAERHGGQPGDYDVKFDIVAHSMGGLIARYMLRYGDTDLPDDPKADPLPVTWAGAEHVEKVIQVGTPNAGSALALTQLVDGAKFGPFIPTYEAAILGTMPSIYQLLPRDRHGPVVGFDGEDLLSVETWQGRGWGLASPTQDRVLRRLLPGVDDADTRRATALAHLERCLDRAAAFHAALDRPAELPDGVELYLFAGDAQGTPRVLTFRGRDDALVINEHGPGDGTVTRASALMDERLDGAWTPKLRSPIDFTGVTFLHEDHLGLTRSSTFSDNVLYLLLEQP